MSHSSRYFEVIYSFTKLGFSAFGGPVAHLAFFREEFVAKRRWMDETEFADLVAFCQFLPGPASSQVAIALGLKRAGIVGAFSSFLSFALPSVFVLILFAIGITQLEDGLDPSVLHSLKLVALAVVIHAVWKMGCKICTTPTLISIAAISSIVLLIYPIPILQVGIIVLAGVSGIFLFQEEQQLEINESVKKTSSTRTVLYLSLFFSLLIIPAVFDFANPISNILYGFYYAGSLVFGGGHVVLPLLESHFVPPGWIERDLFLAGYGVAQAVPGPLFTFSAYLGASITELQNPWLGGILSLAAIYLPSFLLVFALLPHWDRLRYHRTSKAALKAVNAAVVGLLLSAMYQPMWQSTIHSSRDFAFLILLYLLLAFWRVPGWLLILGSGSLAWCFQY